MCFHPPKESKDQYVSSDLTDVLLSANRCTHSVAYNCLVASSDPNRESHFPAIEKRYGKPMSHWHSVMKSIVALKYAEQIAHLRDKHGFSQAHANALVMYSRGSSTTRRYETAEDYFKSLDAVKAKTMRKIFASLKKSFPELELVIAWNQPMLKFGKAYVFGASAAANHILIAPWNSDILQTLAPRLTGLEVNKKTARVPPDWSVDDVLLRDMVDPHLLEKPRKSPETKPASKGKKSR